MGRIAVDKDLAILLDDLHFLLGDGPADIVCLTHGVTAQGLENVDDLFLVNDTAVGNLQNRLQKGRFIPNFPGIQLVCNKGRDGIHRAGAIQCNNSRHIFNRGRLHVDAHAGDTGRFQLKYALGLTFGQHGKGSRIIVRHFGDIKAGLDLTDLLLGILNNR